MKKFILGASMLAAAMVGPSAHAGGIQIDPTGSGDPGSSVFVVDPGSSIGDALFHGLAQPGYTGTIYGHNRIILPATLGGLLTFVFGREATSTAGVGGNVAFLDDGAAHDTATSYFHMFWTTAAAVNSATGVGYDSGIHLASGTVSINATQGGFMGETTLGVFGTGCVGGAGTGCLGTGSNATSDVPTFGLSGSLTLDVEFIESTINTAYVVNDLTTAVIDLFIGPQGLAAPYLFSRPASNSVGIGTSQDVGDTGGSLLGGFGVGIDGNNNMACGSALVQCSVQAQMSSTLQFESSQVPEPGTLALAGMALSLMGWRARRRS